MLTPRIYFRTSQEVEEEWQWIRRSGLSFTTWLSDLEGHIVIPRYSALPFYKEVEEEINMIGGHMINSYQQHQYVADIKNWYPDLQQFTPKILLDS